MRQIPKDSTVKDPLTAVGIVKAIQEMAEMFDGCTTKEAAFQWAINVGFLRAHPRDREQTILTKSGQYAVWLFWKTVEEGRQLGREEIDLG